jgi:G:T/U-mismatch repair DNA glycosylase
VGESGLLPEIWESGLHALFVSAVVDEQSHTFGFHHLHPRDRFWELLEISSITPARVISAGERKALAEGHAKGNVSEPVRAIFMQKKTSQMIRAGIGVTALNRRIAAKNEKDSASQPTADDVEEFIEQTLKLAPRVVGFVVIPDVFTALFKHRYPAALPTPGLQPFSIGGTEVWLLGSTVASLRGEALLKQEDVFFSLGERIQTLVGDPGAAPH